MEQASDRNVTGNGQQKTEIDLRETAFRLGGLVNQFDWYLSQAWLLGNGECFDAAVNALVEIRTRLAGLCGSRNVEQAVERVRKLLTESELHFSSEGHVACLESLRTTLEQVKSEVEDNWWEVMAEERESFLNPVSKLTAELRGAVESVLDATSSSAFALGLLVDEGVRPRGVHRHVFLEPVAAEVSEDESFAWWQAAMNLEPPETPTVKDTAVVSPGGTNTEPVEPDPNKRTSTSVAPNYVGNHIVAPGEIAPEPGWLREVGARWLAVFGRQVDIPSEGDVCDGVEHADPGYVRLYRTIVSQASSRDPRVPACELEVTTRTAFVAGTKVEFGRAKALFALLQELVEAGGDASKNQLLKRLGKRDQSSNFASLHTNIKRLREELSNAKANADVIQMGEGYGLRRKKPIH